MDWLKKIKINSLLVVGSEDTIVKREISQKMQTILLNSSYVEIANAGHYPYLTHEEKFNQIFTEFTKKIDDRMEKGELVEGKNVK